MGSLGSTNRARFFGRGRGVPLLEELEREIDEGETRPMEEGFAERRSSNVAAFERQFSRVRKGTGC